jgi:hypothetical protein
MSISEKPVKKMTRRELEEELLALRKLWNLLPEKVRYMTTLLGQKVRIRTTYNVEALGILRYVDWDVASLEVLTEMKSYRYEKGKYYMELKVVSVDKSRIANFEVILEEKELEETLPPVTPPSTYGSEE